MAIIGKIRDRSGLLLIVVGIAMLAFILGGWDSMFGGTEDKLGIGTVYGEMVDQIEFSKEVEKTMTNDQQQAAQSQREFTPQDQKASADRAWNSVVDKLILQREYDKLGIDCSDDEMDAYLFGLNGFTLLPDIASAYKDSITGQFVPAKLTKRIEEMANSTDPKVAQGWEDNKKQIKEARKSEKYYQLLAQGVYATKLEAKQDYLAQKEIKSISFILKRYSEIKDSEVSLVTDEQVRKYYEEHKGEKKYESTAGRDVRYFDIAIQPNRKDSTAFFTELNKIKTGFQNSKNDSLFVLANSDVKFFTSTHQATFKPENDPNAKKGMTFPQYMDTIFKSASIGQIVGPYADMGKTRLAKVIDFNTKVCKVRHILLSAQKGDEPKFKLAQAKADSLMKTLTKDNFTEYVTKYSQDQGSIEKGGVYENFMDYEMVQPFAKFSTDEPIGKIGSVRTDFGIHIIEVLDRTTVKYPVLEIIEKTLKPSEETETAVSETAYDLLFSIDNKVSRMKDLKSKIQLFDSLASKNKFFARPLRIMDENPTVTGFTTEFAEDRILKMAYDANAEEGDLCSSPIKDQQKYVIAMLTSIRVKGIPDYEDVEERMKYEVIKEVKSALYIKKMLKVRSLDALSRKLNTSIMKAEINFSNPQIAGAGFEAEIIGSVFSGMKPGALSIPLKGEQGVYVIQVIKAIKAPAAANYNAERDQIISTGRSQMQNTTRNALRKKAEVVDNRRLGALGIRREI